MSGCETWPLKAGWRRRRRGGALINIILGLLILVGLLGSAYSLFRKGDDDARIAALQTRTNLIVWEIQRLYGGGPFNGITVGTYNPATHSWSGGIGALSNLDPQVFEGVQVVVALSGAGYCMNITGYAEETCRRAAKRLHIPGMTHHSQPCEEEPSRLRMCYYGDGGTP